MRDSYAFYTDKLTGEYRTVFDEIEMYIGTQTCDDITKEDKLSQLLDMFLSAEEEGKPVHKIVGGSVEEFCKTFCSDFGFEGTMLNILDMFKTLAWCFIVLSVFDIISMDWIYKVHFHRLIVFQVFYIICQQISGVFSHQ